MFISKRFPQLAIGCFAGLMNLYFFENNTDIFADFLRFWDLLPLSRLQCPKVEKRMMKFKYYLNQIPFHALHSYIEQLPLKTLFYVCFAFPLFLSIVIAYLRTLNSKTSASQLSTKAREQLAERSFQKMQKDMTPPHKSA